MEDRSTDDGAMGGAGRLSVQRVQIRLNLGPWLYIVKMVLTAVNKWLQNAANAANTANDARAPVAQMLQMLQMLQITVNLVGPVRRLVDSRP
jgi:hypothetical protein